MNWSDFVCNFNDVNYYQEQYSTSREPERNETLCAVPISYKTPIHNIYDFPIANPLLVVYYLTSIFL